MSAPLLVLRNHKQEIYPQPVEAPALRSRRGRYWLPTTAWINEVAYTFWRTQPKGDWFYFKYRDIWFRITPEEATSLMTFEVVHDRRCGGSVGEEGSWS